jgi:hypothetical protein
VPSIFNVHRPLIGIVPGLGTALKSNSGWSFECFIRICYLPQAGRKSGHVIVDKHVGYRAHDLDEEFLAPP